MSLAKTAKTRNQLIAQAMEHARAGGGTAGSMADMRSMSTKNLKSHVRGLTEAAKSEALGSNIRKITGQSPQISTAVGRKRWARSVTPQGLVQDLLGGPRHKMPKDKPGMYGTPAAAKGLSTKQKAGLAAGGALALGAGAYGLKKLRDRKQEQQKAASLAKEAKMGIIGGSTLAGAGLGALRGANRQEIDPATGRRKGFVRRVSEGAGLGAALGAGAGLGGDYLVRNQKDLKKAFDRAGKSISSAADRATKKVTRKR